MIDDARLVTGLEITATHANGRIEHRAFSLRAAAARQWGDRRACYLPLYLRSSNHSCLPRYRLAHSASSVRYSALLAISKQPRHRRGALPASRTPETPRWRDGTSRIKDGSYQRGAYARL